MNKSGEMVEVKVCSFCNWTNTGLINIGAPNQTPLWICHHCIQKQHRQLLARDAALVAARVALSLVAGISAVRSDKKLDHQIKEAKEASVSAIEQIDLLLPPKS